MKINKGLINPSTEGSVSGAWLSVILKSFTGEARNVTSKDESKHDLFRDFERHLRERVPAGLKASDAAIDLLETKEQRRALGHLRANVVFHLRLQLPRDAAVLASAGWDISESIIHERQICDD